MNQPEQIWYAFRGKKYSGTKPAFYSEAEFPFLAAGKKDFETIKNEVLQLVSSKSGVLQPYFNSSFVNLGGKWDVTGFYFWGERNNENCEACPALDRFLRSIPGLLTAGLSRLAPATEIMPHIGDTNAVVRCHLGLSIPAGLPDCGFEVKDEKREWKDGEWLIFCDAHSHHAWNRTNEYRYLLLLDFILPEYTQEKDEVVKNVRSYMQLQELIGRKPWIGKLPGKIKGMIRHSYKRKL